MKENENISSSPGDGTRNQMTKSIKGKVGWLNAKFNTLPLKVKQVCVISFGMMTSMLCLVLVVQALQTKINDTIQIEKITLPNDIYMTNTDTTKQLIPVGKLKGEIAGEFEAFYVAVDNDGQVFINRNPSFGANRFVKSEEWKPITHQQLEAYRKELHFFPHKVKGLKP